MKESGTALPAGGYRDGIIVWSGFAFVALFLASLVMLGDLFGSFADSDAHFIAYHSSKSNQIQVVIGGYLITAAGLTLLVFLTRLTTQDEDGRRDHLRLLAFVSGIVGVTLWLAGGAALVTSAGAKTFGATTGDAPLTGDAVAVAPQLGYVLIFLSAMWAVAFSIGAYTLHIWTAGCWPGWLRWLSVFTAIMLLVSAALFNPIILLPVWVGAIAIREFRRTASASADPT